MRSVLRPLVDLVAGFVFGAMFIFALGALAQDPAAPPAPDLAAIIQQALQAFGSFRAGAVFAGLVVVVHLLTDLTKIPFLAQYVPDRARPWISLGLSVVGAGVGALATGASWSAALVAALTAAFASGGLHEMVNTLNPAKQAERAAGAAIADAVLAGDKTAAAAVAAQADALREIAALQDQKARVEALAAWANAHPPRGAA